MRNGYIILFVILSFQSLIGYSQKAPSKLILSQGFIDSMYNQTQEHLIMDTLSNYYSQFELERLNTQQKDLVFINKFQDSLYKYDFIDLMVNHSDLILINAYETFKRINCRTTLSKIEEFKTVKEYFDPLFVNGKTPDILNEDSPKYDHSEETKIYSSIFAVEEWICFLPREKVLSMYYYIIDNKDFLYQ